MTAHRGGWRRGATPAGEADRCQSRGDRGALIAERSLGTEWNVAWRTPPESGGERWPSSRCRRIRGSSTADPQGAERRQRVKTFKVYRYDPEGGGNPRLDTFEVDLDDCGPMVLDALIKIKTEQDSSLDLPPLVPRGRVRLVLHEHRRPQHARLHQGDRGHRGRHQGLPAAAHGGDQGPGHRLLALLRAVRAIEPWLQTDTPPPEREWRQTPEDRARLNGLYECILCACCSTACPSYWWNPERFLGPAVLLQAQRWLADSRDERAGERLDELEDPFRLYRCHTIMNCANTCPKGLNPAKAIAEIKKLMVEREL